MNLKPDAIRNYFSSRLGVELRIGQNNVKCPLHDDKVASLSINTEKGTWHCHGPCGSGGILKFEMNFAGGTGDDAKKSIAEITHGEVSFDFRAQPEAIYEYVDALGNLKFQKLRYPGKRFAQREPSATGGWNYKLSNNTVKPLYNLPKVIVSNYILVCEGEKDCDNLQQAINSWSERKLQCLASELEGTKNAPLAPAGYHPTRDTTATAQRGARRELAPTTNFDGAGKWRDSYSPYLAGKLVVILPDNDQAGGKHAQHIAQSVYRYAAGLKICLLPGLPEKGDVSDWLKSGKTVEDLLAEIQKTEQWLPQVDDGKQKLFVDALSFMEHAPQQIDWLVTGVIQRGCSGFICADPKAGKSWLGLDLAISLATGAPFLGCTVPKPARVAMVSREDNPALTSWRMQRLTLGKAGMQNLNLDRMLYINTRAQSPQLMLDNEEQMGELLKDLGRLRPELLILDVLNVMHSAEENDNTEMRRVLDKVKYIQTQVECSICIVHHFSKNGEGQMTKRLRGASAISGFAEWLIGLSTIDSERHIRCAEFESKSAQPLDKIYFSIESAPGGEWSRIELQQYEMQSPQKSKAGRYQVV